VTTSGKSCVTTKLKTWNEIPFRLSSGDGSSKDENDYNRRYLELQGYCDFFFAVQFQVNTKHDLAIEDKSEFHHCGGLSALQCSVGSGAVLRHEGKINSCLLFPQEKQDLPCKSTPYTS